MVFQAAIHIYVYIGITLYKRIIRVSFACLTACSLSSIELPLAWFEGKLGKPKRKPTIWWVQIPTRQTKAFFCQALANDRHVRHMCACRSQLMGVWLPFKTPIRDSPKRGTLKLDFACASHVPLDLVVCFPGSAETSPSDLDKTPLFVIEWKIQSMRNMCQETRAELVLLL